jgi:L,D-peptidoglycan transpeptidase YkuD (ErfK/YbiS/YcfS/YnhG family)
VELNRNGNHTAENSTGGNTMTHFKRGLWVLMILCLPGCGKPPAPTPAVLAGIPVGCKQALVVTPTGPHPFSATLTCYQKNNDEWVVRSGPIPAVTGPKGITPAPNKKEGDGHTPAGIYALGPAFGYAPAIATKLLYRQCTDQDYWIDEAQDDQYNTWVVGKPVGKSYERMKRDDDAYAVGAVIQYNTKPVVKGKGSAIFFHVWTNADKPTAGCVAIERKTLEDILAWLDESQQPHIVILEK